MRERVLVIINTMDMGGAETFVMKVFRALDRGKTVFDFLVNSPQVGFYEKEIASLGGRIYRGVPKSQSPARCWQFIRSCVKANGYRRIFCVSEHPLAALDILSARLGGARRVIVRSATSRVPGRLSGAMAFLCRPLVRLLADACLAPSPEAAVWMFGKQKAQIVPNGIVLDDYAFSGSRRQSVRDRFGIGDAEPLYGHVGRFSAVKNHAFLLAVFCEILKQTPDARLMLIGDGPLRDETEASARALGIEERVIFTGVQTDVPSFLMAMDLMIFPSLYEGMPNALIEAQAAGLPCLAADTVTNTVAITPLVEFLSLSDSPAIWAGNATSRCGKRDGNTHGALRDAGYSIEHTAENIMSLLYGREARPI